MRFVTNVLLPFLAPTLVYLAWVWARGRKADRGPTTMPWAWLVIAGAGLVVASLLVFDRQTSGQVGGRYEPAHLDAQGRVVPSRILPPADAPAPATPPPPQPQPSGPAPAVRP